MNPLTVDGTRYLVAPRGNAQWVRNLRVIGTGELRVGRRAEPFSATEVNDDDKPAILREYLKHWKWEVGVFFDGVDAKAPTEKLREIAPATRSSASSPAEQPPPARLRQRVQELGRPKTSIENQMTRADPSPGHPARQHSPGHAAHRRQREQQSGVRRLTCSTPIR